MNPAFDKAIEFVSETVTLFYSGAGIEEVVGRFTDDFSWIGAGDVEFSTDSAGIISYLVERAPLAPPCEVFDGEFHLVNVTDHTCTVMGRYHVRTDAASGMVLEERQRCSYELVDENGALKIRHVHVSNPYQAMKDEPYFPFEAGAQSYEYLQQLVREKTKTIDFITKNITGGLKVSEDDEFFSFAYVNDGLAHMLGYTSEEFMEMSGGTAVGAVYPPDLDNALADVARCFAAGPSYETEYRIRRKDGTLAWVIDSGIKVPADDGSVKINSVLMDITSRKIAEQELELERERYRIALRSVTDVLFEYDIEQDTLTEFERVPGTSEDAPLEARSFSQYSKEVEAGNRFHPDDYGRLVEALKSGEPVTVDIRFSLPEKSDDWVWVRMHATMIVDPSGRPLRTIGSWKDITEERNRISELEEQARRDPLTKLYNQITASDLVERALPDCLKRNEGALFVIDVDNFKAVNDSVGHLVGDSLLTDVARAIAAVFTEDGKAGCVDSGRSGVAAAGCRRGIAARVGGDEFMAFLPEADREAARQAAIELSRAAEADRASAPSVTLSIGVALAGHDGESYERLFAEADRALYQAKREGKDRICFADGDAS